MSAQMKKHRFMSSRPKEASSRVYYLIADVTKEQKRAILAHCTKHQVSVSKFLAGLAVADARNASRFPSGYEEEVTFTVKLPPEKVAKLKIFSHRKGKSVSDALADLLNQHLDKQQVTSDLELQTLRYYLSPEEHELVNKSLKARGLASRNYIGPLALEALHHKA
jgi:hypothetical protein